MALLEYCETWYEPLPVNNLGQIWKTLHTRPIFLTAAILTILCLYLPRLIRRYKEYRLSNRVIPFHWPIPKEANPNWTGKIILHPSIFSHETDNTLFPPETGHTGDKRDHITCFDPSTAYHLMTLPLLTEEQVAEQVQKAVKAQINWKETSFAERVRLMRSLKGWILRDMEGIVSVACRDTGKTRIDAMLGEILVTLSKIDWMLKYGQRVLSPQKRPTNLLLAHKVCNVHYHPLGCVLACVSWNYSFHNLLSPILAALFAGNSIVVKCSEQVAWSSMWYIGGIRACLRACGMDQEVVQLVVALPDVAERLTRNPSIKHITFIGSESVGRKVAQAAAEIMVPTCIELGGKDPAFLLPSADLDYFASTLLRGTFQSAGQNCIGIELILVPRNLQQRLVDIVLPRIESLRLGQDVGSLVSSVPVKRLERLLSTASSSGARILTGGKAGIHPQHPHGAYFQPTLVVDVRMDMEIAQQELFAPVMTVVPYDNIDEAIGWLNGNRYGLGAGVYGSDRKECRRVAEALECGMVAINDFAVFYVNQAMPFGGVKASGHGRFGGEEGLRSLCYTKSVVEDRLFSWIRTPIPRPVDYPLPPIEISWGFLHGLMEMIYAPHFWGRLKGLGELLGASMRKFE
ncbi:meiotic Sister-Chromatid recombination aldehyde dehydrogenase [Tremella mesenterica]|uniref:Meiotic Sister-Chromatid recombination aldehyde dehydrogenase n=1 Tax=Tremella mesenterica TaxID=5217 RepID=A0A4Q1BP94_TREME|nr:meiotic Sister-Chromatid recombination aldehyde dehydrogenase [Tremella mesenterica]